MKTNRWSFVKMGTKTELKQLQKKMIDKKTRIEPMTVMVLEGSKPLRKKHTYKLEKYVY
jgi:hypothetical protein